jgi:hypothetical protein
MRGCGESLRRSLSATGKTVTVYEYAGTGCIPANGTSMPASECDALSGNAPQFTLYHGNGTQMTFYAYYAHSALLTGNDGFYSRCYIAKVLNGTA